MVATGRLYTTSLGGGFSAKKTTRLKISTNLCCNKGKKPKLLQYDWPLAADYHTARTSTEKYLDQAWVLYGQRNMFLLCNWKITLKSENYNFFFSNFATVYTVYNV